MTPQQFSTHLARLSDEVRKSLQKAIVAEANRLADAMRARVHVASGETRASIQVSVPHPADSYAYSYDSILGPAKGPAGTIERGMSLRTGKVYFAYPISVHVTAGGELTTTHTPAGSYDHALAEEYGTHKMAARPFFWHTYFEMRSQIEQNILHAVSQEIGSFFLDVRGTLVYQPAVDVGTYSAEGLSLATGKNTIPASQL